MYSIYAQMPFDCIEYFQVITAILCSKRGSQNQRLLDPSRRPHPFRSTGMSAPIFTHGHLHRSIIVHVPVQREEAVDVHLASHLQFLL
jgi:hypothetical protein